MLVFFLEGDYDMTLREYLNFQYGFLGGHSLFFQFLTGTQSKESSHIFWKVVWYHAGPQGTQSNWIGFWTGFWKCLLEETCFREQSFLADCALLQGELHVVLSMDVHFHGDHWSVTIRSYQWTFYHLTFSSSCPGVLHLLEHEEEYVFTLPSAYARSILTIPWVELGGKVNINCARTGYSATVTFHTKPFYGGKVHRYGNYCLTLVYLLLDFRGKALGYLFSSSVAVFYSQIAEVLFLLVLEMT